MPGLALVMINFSYELNTLRAEEVAMAYFALLADEGADPYSAGRFWGAIAAVRREDWTAYAVGEYTSPVFHF